MDTTILYILIPSIAFILWQLSQFDMEYHRRAGLKAIFLWLLSFFPILLAAGLSKVSDDKTSVLVQFFTSVGKHFTAENQFIYTAAFLPPILFTFLPRAIQIEKSESKNFVKISYNKHLKGYMPIYVSAILVLLLTSASYGAYKTNSELYSNTILHHGISKFSLLIYLFSLYCWYLSIISDISENPSSGKEAVKKLQKESSEFTEKLSTRIKNRKDGN